MMSQQQRRTNIAIGSVVGVVICLIVLGAFLTFAGVKNPALLMAQLAVCIGVVGALFYGRAHLQRWLVRRMAVRPTSEDTYFVTIGNTSRRMTVTEVAQAWNDERANHQVTKQERNVLANGNATLRAQLQESLLAAAEEWGKHEAMLDQRIATLMRERDQALADAEANKFAAVNNADAATMVGIERDQALAEVAILTTELQTLRETHATTPKPTTYIHALAFAEWVIAHSATANWVEFRNALRAAGYRISAEEIAPAQVAIAAFRVSPSALPSVDASLPTSPPPPEPLVGTEKLRSISQKDEGLHTEGEAGSTETEGKPARKVARILPRKGHNIRRKGGALCQ